MEKRRLNNLVTWNTNHHLRRPQASFHSPKGEEALRPPQTNLRSLGKISRLGEYPRSRWEFSLKGKERMTRGNQSFQKLIWFLYFSGLLIYFLLYIGMNTESRGGQQTWPLSKSGASYKRIQRSYGFYIIFWPWDLLTFMALSDNGQPTRKLIFSRGDFSSTKCHPPNKVAFL